MTTERTPAEWARFCAEKVMGWKPLTVGLRHVYHKDETDSDAWVRLDECVDPDSRRYWSPWHNLADAREVLQKLEKITGRWATIEHVKDLWIVGLGDWEDYVAHDTGPHEGPAICLLAGRVTNDN